MKRDKIIRLKYHELEADVTAVYQQAAEWKTEGICGIAQEKEKNCFSKERTMLIS